ncbi:hypothetical protein DRN69_02220 [Candidatus Pacearchaeota archaeon]|nr:MAG: hypothetical protein DRN69_02220 [Candidatus Pacearchaeota archaeon]
MDFLFHKVSEKEKKEIQKQAKKIMDSFARELSKIDKKMKEPVVESDKDEREEIEGECDENFSRDIMFQNAPKKNEDFIISEKRKW